MRFTFEVLVTLKPGLADPQGKAVHGALPRLGFHRVTDVRQGKRFELEVDGEVDDAVLAEIHELAGTPFNVGSPKQLGEVLFDRLSLGGGRKGKTGAYTTGADVLEELAAQGHDLPQRVLDWRLVAKLKSTYTDTLQEYEALDRGLCTKEAATIPESVPNNYNAEH